MAGLALVVGALGAFVPLADAQVAPPAAMRPAESGPQAILGATVIPAPDAQPIPNAIVLIRDGRIERVASAADLGQRAPAGYRVWNAEGLTLYPGLIETAYVVDSNAAAQRAASGAGAHWNRRVIPQVGPEDLEPLKPDAISALHKLGFTTAQVLPEDGLFRGRGSVLLLDTDPGYAKALVPESALFVGFDLQRGVEGEPLGTAYPSSLMGAIALERQTFLDARWHAAQTRAWAERPDRAAPPIDARALDALLPYVGRAGPGMVVFDAPNERDLVRQLRVADEFDLKAAFLGTGTEFRRAKQFDGQTVIVPPRFPRTPDVSSPAKTDSLTLYDLRTWRYAPTNAARLERAGADVVLTSAKLEDRGDFRKHVRTAIQHGWSPSAALAALTTRPARLLGCDATLGTIAPGKIANLVLVNGTLFGDDRSEPGAVRAVWVAGRRHEVEPAPLFPIDGPCVLTVAGGPSREARLDLADSTLQVKIDAERVVTVRRVAIDRDRFTATFDGAILGRDGSWRASGVGVGGAVEGTAIGDDGTTLTFRIERGNSSLPAAPVEAPNAELLAAKRTLADDPLPFPFGDHGLAEAPKPETVLVRNATIWTSSDRGILEGADLLVAGGKIEAVGTGLAAPEGARVIDAAGRHVTPGLIDCHSHTGIDGGVNEGTHANSAECRIGDVVNPEDVGWYRELAGGLTVANQLHGSSNPIGGQNSVVKLRWGEDERAFPIKGAIPGIKFALGENVVRTRGRYPDTRMGVETFIRDAFEAARRYDSLKTDDTRRPDLELETLAEILRGERIIHCHSYRQDEILMLIRLADSLGFRIGTFQHVLEGFKVADEIAKHGAGASSFSDWWAYKMEVMDAIPWNGAILDKIGVVTSFNSDSGELARRMNMEAAKAVRYGGLEPHEALAFVTINPAKQLRIDARVGSLEPGKDADFVIWSANPLSVYARVDETWVDGARRFERTEDAERTARDLVERERLLVDAAAIADEARQKARREREKSDGTTIDGSDAKPDASAKPRPFLLGLLAAREAAFMELVRRGYDPDDMRPGDCGCETQRMGGNQ
ncbi:MAG: amidohydrolase family protein [Phycisphaerae bacterium]|nr:amidohydrolase family protein [Phycisphaerae bacterium]